MDPTVLFIYLKIILLQYFQFLIFNFNNGKLNPNATLCCDTEGPRVMVKKKEIFLYGKVIDKSAHKLLNSGESSPKRTLTDLVQ